MAYVNLARGLGVARDRRDVFSAGLSPRRPWRRGIAGGDRGLGRLSFPQVMVSVPQPAPFPPTSMPTAETSLANGAAEDANDYMQFLAANNSPQYQNPAAYTANMIAFARTLCMNSWAPYTCVGFDPVAMGTKYANAVFAALQSIKLASGKSVYDTWISSPVPVTPGYTPPLVPAAYNAASVPGSSALPPPPSTSAPTPQPVAGSFSSTPASSTSSSPAPPSASVSVSGNGSGSPAVSAGASPNWPLIAGGAALLLGGLYFLGGSK